MGNGGAEASELSERSFVDTFSYSNATLRAIEYYQGDLASGTYAGSFGHPGKRPVTLLMVFSNVVLFTYVAWKKVPVSAYGFSYSRMKTHGEFWRIFTAFLAHEDVLHFLFDVLMLWSASALEMRVGPVVFCTYTLFMLISTSLLYCLTCEFISRKLNLDLSLYGFYTVGITPAIFGHLTILSYKQTHFDVPLFPGLLLPLALFPIMLLFIASLVVNRSKFLQHMFGLFSGVLVELGAVHWINAYWLFHMFLWVAGSTALSVHCTTGTNVYGLKVYFWPFRRTTGETRPTDIESPESAVQESRGLDSEGNQVGSAGIASFTVVDATFENDNGYDS